MIRMLLLLATAAAAQTQPPALTYVPNSTVKLYQVNGDCDWTAWDATITAKTPTCKPTASQTETRADVLGDDVPVAFEHNGELIVTFGDTIGALGYSAWTTVQNSFQWQAHDPIARSTTASVQDGLTLNFFLSGNHGLEVQPPPQPNGTPVNMAGDNVPNTGISLNGQIYLGLKTGAVALGGGNTDLSNAYSLLATFDETAETFSSGRTLSSSPNGHFMLPTFYQAPPGDVMIFGLGPYRASNVYLSTIPASQFWTGLDATGAPASRYFAGLSNGQPTWSASESAATPIVTDLDPANPTIGNLSVFYSQPLGLWLMMYDGGRGSINTVGMYFTYAAQPWGPWSTPQLVFNDCRDKGLGNFIFYYYATANANNCPSAMPPGVTSAPNSAGPAGPTIGDQSVNDPHTTRGGAYAPAFVERFTTISGNTLKLYYMFSTWNPYAVVMMESDFNIVRGPLISLVANAEGESAIIAPNTWVEIKGNALAPAGDSRIWQTSDFVNGQLPTQLDGVGATVNGKPAFVYYISPTQVNILTPPDAINGPVQVVVSNNGTTSATYTAQAQATSPSFFVVNGGPYVVAVHLDGSLISPTSPAKPAETIVLYANGFGPAGTLSPLPAVRIGGAAAAVQFAGTISPGLFQFNVVVPASAANGDQSIGALYNGVSTQAGTLITVHN